MPLNCVYVKGEPDTALLNWIREVFGFLRRVVWLSRTYDGGGFEHCYALDPVDGTEQTISVNLTSELVSEAEKQPDDEEERSGMAEAINCPSGTSHQTIKPQGIAQAYQRRL